jgi:hypothetical protein
MFAFGDDVRETLREIRQAVKDFIGNEMDSGPGWVVTDDKGNAWDVKVTVTLQKKPPKGGR